MELIDYVAMSKSRYTSQFDEDPVFDAIVQTIIEYKMKVQQTYIDFADSILDIEKSTGRNLDLIGRIVGQDRVLVDYFTKPYFGFEGNPKAEPYDVGLWYSMFGTTGGDSRTLTDDEFRRVIKARIIRNKTNCNRQDFGKVMDLLLNIDRDNPKPDDVFYKVSYSGHGNIILELKDFEDGVATHYLSKLEDVDNIIPVPLGYRLIVKIIE